MTRTMTTTDTQCWVTRSNRILETLLSHTPVVAKMLAQAMRYSLLSPGKRLRPTLMYHIAHSWGIPPEKIDYFAAAIEAIHAYSLIHDDLPAMDDDDWRRDLPSCHKAFDEATAILAGDALQALAFEWCATADTLTTEQRLQGITTLSQAIGPAGMAGGQALDCANKMQTLSETQMTRIHALKTAALIEAAASLAATACALNRSDTQALITFARALGIGFQWRDDLLDNTTDDTIDINARCQDHLDQCRQALDTCHVNTDSLIALAEAMLFRSK